MPTRTPRFDFFTNTQHSINAGGLSRRKFLKWSLAAAAGAAIPFGQSSRILAGLSRKSRDGLIVKQVERVTVRVPYRETPNRAMNRELPHWRYTEIVSVHLESGDVGRGETLLYYTWGVPSDDDFQRVVGKNAVDLLWDDSLGAGLQMAMFDAVGRALRVPVHRLLGNKVHDTTPLSWWNIDMPPSDMAAECALAHKQGYMAYKTKGRPWFDLWEQMKQSTAVVPPEFKIDMDFNDTLADAERAIPILKELEAYPQVDIYETPIPQKDVAGNVAIREATRVQIALHYGTPSPAVCVKEGACDGLIIGGGASRVMQQGAFCDEVDYPFWLQLVGTGLTAAMSLHFGGVLSQARWPAVNCHQLYQHTLLTEPITVKDGFAVVPDKPGLGFDVDEEAINRYRVQRPAERPDPDRLLETTWVSGRKMYFANTGEVNIMLSPAMRWEVPYFEKGVTTRMVPNDGSAKWKELHARAKKKCFIVEP